MYQVFRTIAGVGILCLAMGAVTGCEEKRIHVATLSGTSGEPEETLGSDTPNASQTDETAGLPGVSLDESSLAGTSGQENLEPAPTSEIPETSGSAPSSNNVDQPASTDMAAIQPESMTDFSPDTPSVTSPQTSEGMGGFPLADGSSLHTQSGSIGSGIDPLDSTASMADQGGPAGASLPGQPDASEQGTALTDDSFVTNAAQDGDMEQISNSIQVAKVEPSDDLREQMERMKREELASATAELEDVFFQFDSWSLTEEGKQALERNMGWINQDLTANLIIEGHADQRGTQAYNMILGKRRASTIRDYLNKLGVNHQRLTVISYGKDKPFCVDQTEVCHQLNRRGHLLVQNP